MKKYHVISPDGFPIRADAFSDFQQAVEYTRQWSEAFQQQGYYLTSGRQKIPADDLVNHLRLVPANKLHAPDQNGMTMEKLAGRGFHNKVERQPISERSLATVRAAVREEWEREQQAERKESITPQTLAKVKDRQPDEPER